VEVEDGVGGKKYENEEEKKEWKEEKNELAAEKGRLEAEVTKWRDRDLLVASAVNDFVTRALGT